MLLIISPAGVPMFGFQEIDRKERYDSLVMTKHPVNKDGLEILSVGLLPPNRIKMAPIRLIPDDTSDAQTSLDNLYYFRPL